MAVGYIVETSLLIVNIATIAERIQLAQRRCQSTRGRQQLAPCAVLVFYNNATVAVKDSDNIALSIRSLPSISFLLSALLWDFT